MHFRPDLVHRLAAEELSAVLLKYQHGPSIHGQRQKAETTRSLKLPSIKKVWKRKRPPRKPSKPGKAHSGRHEAVSNDGCLLHSAGVGDGPRQTCHTREAGSATPAFNPELVTQPYSSYSPQSALFLDVVNGTFAHP